MQHGLQFLPNTNITMTCFVNFHGSKHSDQMGCTNAFLCICSTAMLSYVPT